MMEPGKIALTYTEAIERLGHIVETIENNNPDVDELLGLTEEAVQLISFCREKLTCTDKSIEQMLEKLNTLDDHGTAEG